MRKVIGFISTHANSLYIPLTLFVLSSGAHVESMVIFFYLSNEGISILENLTKLGVPFPEKIQQIFDDLGRDSPKKN